MIDIKQFLCICLLDLFVIQSLGVSVKMGMMGHLMCYFILVITI